MGRSMKPASLIAAAMLIGSATAQTIAVPSVATDEPPAIRNLAVIPPKVAAVSAAEQAANARIVLQWHYEFFDLGHFKHASDKYLAPDFRQNDSQEPSGRDRYVSFFLHNGYVPRAAALRPPKLAVFTSGNLVLMVIPELWPRTDGKSAWAGAIHCNMFRVEHGKIAAMWVSGDVAQTAAPASRQIGPPASSTR